jgi:hypothetical protein
MPFCSLRQGGRIGSITHFEGVKTTHFLMGNSMWSMGLLLGITSWEKRQL